MTTASTPHTRVAEPRGSRLVLSDKAKYSIKLGLAIAITYGLALRADWMSPTWAAIAVAMIGQPGHGQSLYKGMLRAIGTLIAFFSGLFILMLFPQDRWLILVATSPFLGYFTYRMKGQNSYLWFVAAFVTPMIVMAGPAQPGHAFEFAAYRTLETLMGIGVWALVSVFLWPVNNLGALHAATDQLLATQQKIIEAFRTAATGGESGGRTPRAPGAGVSARRAGRFAHRRRLSRNLRSPRGPWRLAPPTCGISVVSACVEPHPVGHIRFRTDSPELRAA